MKSVIMEIALLKTKSLGELQEMWKEYFNEPTISQNKEFFVSRIAYRIQELAYGGTPKAQQKLIAQMYVPSEVRKNLPPVGTRIIQDYHQTEHPVIILNDGFEHNGIKYPTLSAVAKKITGKKIFGRHFFGIDKYTPYQLDEIIEAFIRLKALGLDATSEALTSYGNTASAFGKNITDFTDAVSSAVMLNFKSLRTFGIQTQVEGDKVRFTFQGITTTVGKSAQEIETYLKSIGLINFGGAIKEQMDTMGGAMSNIEDAVSKLIRSIGENGLNKALKETFLQFNELLDGSGEAAKAIGQTLATAVNTASKAFFTLVQYIEPIITFLTVRLGACLITKGIDLLKASVYALNVDSHNVAKQAAKDHADTLEKLKDQIAEAIQESTRFYNAMDKNKAIAEWSQKLQAAQKNIKALSAELKQTGGLSFWDRNTSDFFLKDYEVYAKDWADILRQSKIDLTRYQKEIWALVDILKADYGARLSDKSIDLNALYQLNQTWTTRGDTFNAVFDSKLTVFEALSRTCKVGRAVPFIQGGIVRFVRDEPKSIPVALFGPRNIVKNSLTIQYIMPSEDTADSVCVQYFSDRTWKNSEVTGTFAESASDKTATVELFGCTDKNQVLREAVYMALAKLLRNYQRLYDLNTPQKIISRYAPPTENETVSYIDSASWQLNITPDTPVDLSEDGVLMVFIKAIIRHENGIQPYSNETLLKGIQMA